MTEKERRGVVGEEGGQMTTVTRIPSVLPDAETSPRHSLAATITTIPDTDPAGRTNNNNNDVNQTGGDLALQPTSTGPSPYFSLPLWHKYLIVLITSGTALGVTFSSTSLFPLTAEVAASFHTTPLIIQITNALFVLTMGLASFIWVPISRMITRKKAWLVAAGVFLLATVGMGLAPEGKAGLRVFIAMRILSGLEGTFFHIAGQSWLADVFVPTERGTAMGFFLVGTVFGPAFGACIGGIMVTFVSWRAVCWLQVAMMGVGLVASIVFLPDIRKPYESHQKDTAHPVLSILREFNPWRILRVMVYPNVLLTDLACGFLAWSQYTLLASPRHIFNPRFNLTTPLVSGLFYIAPGIGFFLGTTIGGKLSDMTVIRWIKRRGGVRLPQDRLNSGLISMFAVVPIASLVYGWGLHFEVGGMALPIVFAFFEGFGILMAFASLNTYCAEVLPRSRSEVIATKYLIQYICSSTGSAAIVPMIDAMGVGPASTFGVALSLIAGVLTLITAKHGLAMQQWVERKLSSSSTATSTTTTTTTTKTSSSSSNSAREAPPSATAANA